MASRVFLLYTHFADWRERRREGKKKHFYPVFLSTGKLVRWVTVPDLEKRASHKKGFKGQV
jgi:hypothetical protein